MRLAGLISINTKGVTNTLLNISSALLLIIRTITTFQCLLIINVKNS